MTRRYASSETINPNEIRKHQDIFMDLFLFWTSFMILIKLSYPKLGSFA